MSKRKAKRDQPSRYVALSHWMLKTEAWRDLDCVARAAYVALSSRYAGPNSNNGRLPFSYDEMADALNVSKATAMRAMQRLQGHGFIVLMKRGSFDFKLRHASEWRLTEYPCDVEDKLATKDFTRWQKQNTVSPEHPIGCRDETDRVSR
jgi:DNA-binding transcriptional MocR family regulator